MLNYEFNSAIPQEGKKIYLDFIVLYCWINFLKTILLDGTKETNVQTLIHEAEEPIIIEICKWGQQ